MSPLSPSSSSPPPDAGAPTLAARLGKLFLFSGWGKDDLDSVARVGAMVRHGKGDVLFQQGDSCEYLHVLLSGEVQMFRVLPDGREVTLHVLHPGALVACAALFLDRAYPASGRVVSREAELARLDGGPFLRLLEARPDLSRKMIAALAGRLSDLADRIESRTADSASVRLAAWLLDQPSRAAQEGARVVKIEGSKKSVAASLGMTPETFSRTLHALAERGVLRVEGKEFHLLDLHRLEEETTS